MTAPGGLPGLPPPTYLTIANIEAKLQDMTAAAMRGRATDWVPDLVGSTTGLSPTLVTTGPFGILFDIWSRFNHLIATADPNTIKSKDDLDNLIVEFVSGLPLVAQYIDLLSALTGTYTGTDPTLLQIKAIFSGLSFLYPAAAPNGDGTATPSSLSSVIFGNDGTARYATDSFTKLWLPGDGTAQTVNKMLTELAQGQGQLRGLVQQTGILQSKVADAASAAAQANQNLAELQTANDANQQVGGNYVTITPAGKDSARPSLTDFPVIGPSSGDLAIRGGNGFLGIREGRPDGIGYWASLAQTFQTDDQQMEVLLGDEGAFNKAYTTVYTHANPTHTEGSFARISNSGIIVGSYTRNPGANVYTYTPFQDGTYSAQIPSGARAGVRNVGAAWFALVNGVATFLCNNNSVAFDSGHRSGFVSEDKVTSSGFWGFGPSSYESYRIKQIGMADYVQPTYKGSGAKIWRSNATGVTPVYTAGSAQLMPANFFDNTQVCTQDMVVDLATGKITCLKDGWYHVVSRVQFDTFIQGLLPISMTSLIARNGAIEQYGENLWGYFYAGVQGGNFNWHSSHDIYCFAGDYLQLGYYNNTSLSNYKFIGVAGSPAATYFTVSLSNRSFA